MGYNTRLEGKIKIDPPLTAAEMREHKEVNDQDGGSVWIPGEKQRENTETGYTVVIEGRVIEPTTDEAHKAYNLMDELKLIATTWPERTYTGYIYCYGDDDGDISRVSIKDGKVVEETPKIVWPDGTTQEP